MANNFSITRDILTRRPRIAFVEPAQVPGEQAAPVEAETQLLEKKVQVQTLVEQYKRIEKLTDIAQKRLDKRAQNMKICLDLAIDAAVIAALRRRFGNVDPCITFAQYRHCLDEIASLGQKNAQGLIPVPGNLNPFRTDIGGYTTENGMLRPETQFQAPVSHIDQEKFQKDSVSKLFTMLLPMLTKLTDGKILQHLLSAPHS